MKKTVIKPEAITFNVAYTNIAAGVKLLRDQLKQNISFAKKLAKTAQKIYDYGNKKCYIDDENGIRPIPGIKKLGDKMDLLDGLENSVYELEELIKNLGMKVK